MSFMAAKPEDAAVAPGICTTAIAAITSTASSARSFKHMFPSTNMGGYIVAFLQKVKGRHPFLRLTGCHGWQLPWVARQPG